MLTALLSALPLASDPKHGDEIVAVLQQLLVRDEEISADGEGKLKLGDKLVKWTSAETAKVTDTSKTSVITESPYKVAS